MSWGSRSSVTGCGRPRRTGSACFESKFGSRASARHLDRRSTVPRPMTEKERQAFVDEAHVAVLSVAGDDGRPPLSVPVWYHYEPGGNIAFFTGTQGRRARKIALIE